MLLNIILTCLLKIAESNAHFNIAPDVVKDGVLYETVYDYSKNKTTLYPRSCYVDGRSVYPGLRYPDDYFNYECVQSEKGEFMFNAVNCVSPDDWDGINPGDKVYSANGSVVSECSLIDGRLRNVIQPVRGCYYNGTIYQQSEIWYQPNPANNSVDYVEFLCNKTESGYFESQVHGCRYQVLIKHVREDGVEEQTVGVGLESVGLDDYFQRTNSSSYRKCVEVAPGAVDIIDVDKSEVTCKVGNVTYEHNDFWEVDGVSAYCRYGEVHWNMPRYCLWNGRRVEYDTVWIDEQVGARLMCGPGVVWKQACVVNGKIVRIGEEVKLSNGCVLYCDGWIRNLYKCENRIEGMKIDTNATQSAIRNGRIFTRGLAEK